MKTLITCRGCDTTWTDSRFAHCAKCHHTFGGVGLFDRHRQAYGEHGKCVNPTTVLTGQGERTMFCRDGIWRGPELTEEQRVTMGWRR